MKGSRCRALLVGLAIVGWLAASAAIVLGHDVRQHQSPAGEPGAETVDPTSRAVSRPPSPARPPDNGLLSDQLRSQALAGAPRFLGNDDESAPSTPLGGGDALGPATRQALQDVNALVQGLREVTRSR